MALSGSVGVLALFQLPVFDVDGITLVSGLTDGQFTKLLFRDDTSQALTVAVAEIASTGTYEVTFTPDQEGLWFVEVFTPNDDVFGEQFVVDTQAIVPSGSVCT